MIVAPIPDLLAGRQLEVSVLDQAENVAEGIENGGDQHTLANIFDGGVLGRAQFQQAGVGLRYVLDASIDYCAGIAGWSK